MVSFDRTKQIRHNRVIDLRKKILAGWTMPELVNFCLVNLQVVKQTAISYIDEAAEPYRKKYNEDQDKIE